MTDREFLQGLVDKGSNADKGYFQYAHLVACELNKSLIEQLRQLVNGPVWDGDVIAKSYRDELMYLGLATRVCCKGEQGFTGATYFAFSVLKRYDQIEKGEAAA